MKRLAIAALLLLVAVQAYAAPFTVPKIYAPGDAITAADRNTELAAIASSLNNVTSAQITDSTITGGDIANGTITSANISSSFFATAGYSQVGMIQMYAGSTQTDTLTNAGWIMCTGASYPKASFPQLWAVIGTAYGPATATHFTLPDFRARMPLGANPTVIAATVTDTEDTRSVRNVGDTGGVERHTLTVAEMATHSHTGYGGAGGTTWLSGIATNGASGIQPEPLSYTGGSQPHNNMTPYVTINYVIYYGKP